MATLKKPPAASISLDTPAICRALERERVRRKLKHYQVAAQLDVSETTIATWRRGGGMSGDVAVRVAGWLDVDLRDFARPPADLGPAQSDAA
jgi:transcriptional regulator with XRE-family HTH domain